MSSETTKKCLICLDDMESDIEFLPCVHSFHGQCIRKWLTDNPLCPICKIPVFISTPQQLNVYNYHKSRRDELAERESRFFQQVSSGAFDNPVGSGEPGNEINNINSNELINALSEFINSSTGIYVRRIPSGVTRSMGQVRQIGNLLRILETTINQNQDNEENEGDQADGEQDDNYESNIEYSELENMVNNINEFSNETTYNTNNQVDNITLNNAVNNTLFNNVNYNSSGYDNINNNIDIQYNRHFNIPVNDYIIPYNESSPISPMSQTSSIPPLENIVESNLQDNENLVSDLYDERVADEPDNLSS